VGKIITADDEEWYDVPLNRNDGSSLGDSTTIEGQGYSDEGIVRANVNG